MNRLKFSFFAIVAVSLVTASGAADPDCDFGKPWTDKSKKKCHRCVTLSGENKCGDTSRGRCGLRDEYEGHCEKQDGEPGPIAQCFHCPGNFGLPKSTCLFSYTNAECNIPVDGEGEPTASRNCNPTNALGKIGECEEVDDKCVCGGEDGMLSLIHI